MKREADIARLMKEEHDRATQAQEQKELEKWQEGVRYAQELERQLEEKEKSKQEAYEEFLKGYSPWKFSLEYAPTGYNCSIAIRIYDCE